MEMQPWKSSQLDFFLLIELCAHETIEDLPASENIAAVFIDQDWLWCVEFDGHSISQKMVLGIFAWWLQTKCLWWFEHVILGVAEHRYGWEGWLEWENWECAQQKPSFLPTSMHQKKRIMACGGWEVNLFIIFAIEKVWCCRTWSCSSPQDQREEDRLDGSGFFHLPQELVQSKHPGRNRFYTNWGKVSKVKSTLSSLIRARS